MKSLGALVYAVFGVLWLTATELVQRIVGGDQQQIYFYSSWLLILITVILLYYIMSLDARIREKDKKERQESESKYRTVFQTTGSATLFIEENAIISLVNAEFEKLFGYTKEELENKRTLIEFLTDESRAVVQEHHRLRLIDPSVVPRDYEGQLIDKNGNIRDLHFTVSMVPNTNKRVVSLVDITEQKQMELVLRQQNDLLDELVKERTSELQLEIVEHRRTELELKYRCQFVELITSISTSFINLMAGDIDKGIQNALAELGQFSEMDRCFVAVIPKNGNTLNSVYEWCDEGIESQRDSLQGIVLDELPWLKRKLERIQNISCSDIEDLPFGAHHEKELFISQQIKSLLMVPIYYGKALLGCLGFHAVRQKKTCSVQDITLLKIVSEIFANALEHKWAERLLRESEERYRQLVDMSPETIVVLRNNEMVFINRAGAKLFGIKDLKEMIGKPLYNYVHPNYWGIVKAQIDLAMREEGETHFVEIECRSNDQNCLDVEMSAVSMFLTDRPAIQVLIRDITERKRIAKEMARLDRLNLIGEMAAGIAHEIRNPMTTVRGFLQLFRGRANDEQSKQYYDLMISELDMANSIITDFLALSKDKAVSLETQNLNAIVESLYPLVQADAMMADKYVRVELEGVPDLLLDKKEINQLMLNFVRNGLEAMSAGGCLTIKTYAEDKDVVLAVQDQGKGMATEVLNKLGTPFFTTKDGGTGLGMAVCYSIAARHKAAINVKTSPHGTTVYVRFKVA